MALVTFICVLIIFGINAVKDYYIQKEGSIIAQELKESKARQIDLERLTAEILGAFKESKEQLAKETIKRIEADRIIAEQKGVTNETLKEYDEAKKRITVDNNNYTTSELCERAKQFGITCLPN